jgi:hypothetical protein
MLDFDKDIPVWAQDVLNHFISINANGFVCGIKWLVSASKCLEDALAIRNQDASPGVNLS